MHDYGSTVGMNRFMRSRLHLAAALLICLIASCSGSEQSAPPSTERRHSFGVDADFATYERAFLEYKDCIAAAGHPIESISFDPTVQLYTAFIPQAAVNNGSLDRCGQKFEPINAGWQMSSKRPKHRYETMSVIESVALCLKTDAGITVPPSMTGKEVVRLMEASGYSFGRCMRIVEPITSDIVVGS